MVKFNIDETGIYINKAGEKEFNENCMTIDYMIDIILSQNKHENDEQINVKRTKMLRGFFNDPNRLRLKINLNTFKQLKYGWGYSDDEIINIIMWYDDYDNINFATYNITDNILTKIKLENGDIFTTNITLLLDNKEDNDNIQAELQAKKDILEEIVNKKKNIRSQIKQLFTDYLNVKTEEISLRTDIYKLSQKIKNDIKC